VTVALAYACFNVVLETPHVPILFWIFPGISAGALVPRARDRSSKR
jgi:hypothetical protein